MMRLTCREIAAACGGEITRGDPDYQVDGFSIDSRTIECGEWFVPLPGEQADGHEYINAAMAKGARGFFYSRRETPLNYYQGVSIKVNDVLWALQETAACYRSTFHIPVMGVTGSSGKTTTKDMLAAVLNTISPVLKTAGNFNNHIGLPLTLLSLREEHACAVLEMAMRGRGDISLLARIASPDRAIITNIGEAHIELLGSKENIAGAKGELLESMGSTGTAFLYGEDPYLRKLGEEHSGPVYYYGWGENVDFLAANLQHTGNGCSFAILFPGGESINVKLPYPGRHMATNALGAAAAGYMLGVPPEKIRAGLKGVTLTAGRLHIVKADTGADVINDTYNANPSSAGAALEVLKEYGAGKRKIAVLGDMLELGDISEQAHRDLGRKAGEAGVDYLLTVGKWSEYTAEEARGAVEFAAHFSANRDIVEFLKKLPVKKDDVILLKGSRGMKLEEIVSEIAIER